MIKRSLGISITLSLFLLILMNSCVFAPTEVYKSEDKKSLVTPQVTCTIDLSMSQDTIYVNAQNSYTYNTDAIVFYLKCNTGDIIQVKSIIDGNSEKANVYLNDKYMNLYTNSSSESMLYYQSFNSNGNSISIYASNLSLGTHTLELQFLTRSGSGSIADNLGAEGYASKRWTIIAVTSNYTVKDTILNGFEKIYWNAYIGKDFKEYVVKGDFDNFEKHLQTNFLIDSSYVGQGRTYYVSVVKKDGTNQSIGSLSVNKDIVSVKPAYLKNVGMILKLENNKYYNAIDSLYILLNNYPDTINIITKYKHDSIFKIEGIVNETYSGAVQVVPKDRYFYSKTSYKYNYQNYISSLRIGQPFINSSYVSLNFFAAVSNDEFIYSYNDELFRYSIVDQKSYSPAVKVCNKSNYWLSSSKKTLVYLDECELKLKALSTANGITSLKNYTTSSSFPTSGLLAVSDVDTKLTYDSQNYIMSVSDMNTGESIATNESITNYAYNVSAQLSSNSKYALYTADSKLNLCLISDNKFNKIWSNGYNNTIYYEFNSENANEFVYQSESTFHIKSTSTGEDISSYWLGDNIFSVDFKNNEMLTYNSPYLRVRNLKDGSLIKEFKTTYCYKGDVILSNNVLIFKSGILYFVK